MKKIIIFGIIIAAFFVFLESQGFFDTPVERMIRRIKRSDIISYDLEWLIKHGQEEAYVSLGEGDDSAIIEQISADNPHVCQPTSKTSACPVFEMDVLIISLSIGFAVRRLMISTLIPFWESSLAAFWAKWQA